MNVQLIMEIKAAACLSTHIGFRISYAAKASNDIIDHTQQDVRVKLVSHLKDGATLQSKSFTFINLLKASLHLQQCMTWAD